MIQLQLHSKCGSLLLQCWLVAVLCGLERRDQCGRWMSTRGGTRALMFHRTFIIELRTKVLKDLHEGHPGMKDDGLVPMPELRSPTNREELHYVSTESADSN